MIGCNGILRDMTRRETFVFGVPLEEHSPNTFCGNGWLSLFVLSPNGRPYYLFSLTPAEMGRVIGRAVFCGGKIVSTEDLDSLPETVASMISRHDIEISVERKMSMSPDHEIRGDVSFVIKGKGAPAFLDLLCQVAGPDDQGWHAP